MKYTVVFVLVVCILLETVNAQRRRPGNRRAGARRQRGRNSRHGGITTTSRPRASRGRCEAIILPMCRGLIPYKRTLLPNQFGHTTQRQVYRAMEYMWSFMDIGCSRNFRVMACGLYLPKCPRGGAQTGLKPCKETCMKARQCRERIEELNSEWPRDFVCRDLLPRKSKQCIPPISEQPRCSTNQHVSCERNKHEFCQGLNFPKGALPNMFLQCSKRHIYNELSEYRPLIESGCSQHLAFLLCGIFQPYCDRPENPFALPCQEICDVVKSDCEAAYLTLYQGLWWPSKLQCHRYPRSTDSNRICVMPSDTVIPIPAREQDEEA